MLLTKSLCVNLTEQGFHTLHHYKYIQTKRVYTVSKFVNKEQCYRNHRGGEGGLLGDPDDIMKYLPLLLDQRYSSTSEQ